MGSAGLIRRCVSEAAHHVANRSAFGTRLSDAPMMQSVIADLVCTGLMAGWEIAQPTHTNTHTTTTTTITTTW